MGQEPDSAFVSRLQDILRIAHELREATALSNPPSQSSTKITEDSSVLIDTINLPSPLPLLPALLEAGINTEVASAASQIYQRRAEQLRQLIQESITTACRSAAEFPVHSSALAPCLFAERLVSIFTGVYLSRLRKWKEEIIQRTKQALETPTETTSGNPRTFNQGYVPVLEYFFKENPFPTHADKLFLAKKSGMHYKQIHVWFQNRRNRTKKERKQLRKRPTYKGPAKPLNKFCERTSEYMVDSMFQTSKPSQPKGTTEIKVAQSNASEVFASSSPLHAFPSPYPPTCHYDPFPCKTGPIYFSEPEWRRMPNAKRPVPLSITIDDLTEKFSHLSVRDGTYSVLPPKLQSHAATIAITVIPPCAPHPSLIVRQYSQPTNIARLRPSVRASVSCSNVFQNPSPTSKPVTLVPISAPPKKSEFPGKRTTIPLPRRLPSQARSTRRDITPSESHSTSSSLYLFSTDTRDRSSFSSASSLSTPRSNTGNIQAPSHSFGSPYSSPLDTPIHPCGLGGVASISPSSIL